MDKGEYLEWLVRIGHAPVTVEQANAIMDECPRVGLRLLRAAIRLGAWQAPVWSE